MAAIDVFFTGLILICLEGQPNCPVGTSGNTAWVVKADGKSRPCKWNSAEETELELRFPKTHFVQLPSGSITCVKDPDDDTLMRCPLTAADICVLPKPSPFGRHQLLDSSLQWVPRIDEVDTRFKSLNVKHLNNPAYVPTRIHFPYGIVGAGEKWPPGAPSGIYRLWSRSDGSDGGALPRELSDRLRVTYDRADELELTDCSGHPLLVLIRNPHEKNAEVVFRNRATTSITPDVVSGYDNLAYLLWYYRLGLWATESGDCPDYPADGRKDAILLRCFREHNAPCYHYGDSPKADLVDWPTMMGPWF